jgi:hypothetical protein
MKIEWAAASSYTSLEAAQDYLSLVIDKKQGPLKACKEQFCSNFPTPTKYKGTTFQIIVEYSKKSSVEVNVKAVQNILNQVERLMGFKRSKVTNITVKDRHAGALLIESSNSWAKHGPLLHLYCLLVRNGSRHDTRCKWQTTVEKWTAGKDLCRAGDNSQFKLIGMELIESIIAKKGALELPPAQSYQEYDEHSRLVTRTKQIYKPEMKGLGICQYAALVNKPKVGAVAA